MYALPCLVAWHAVWWRGLAGHLRAAGIAPVPDTLRADLTPSALWARPDLLFAQTCGYPLTHAFAGRLQVVATPCYDAPGCDGPFYCSVLVVRADHPARSLGDLAGTTAAANEPESFSGHVALREAMAAARPGGSGFREILWAGDHLGALAAVRAGRAAVCAVDAVTHALVRHHAPRRLTGLREIGFTRRAAGLPYVTRADLDRATLGRLRQGLFAALADPALAEARAALLLTGAEILPDDAYADIRRRSDSVAAGA